MDDYERVNAREWDLLASTDSANQHDHDAAVEGWSVVASKKQKRKAKAKHAASAQQSGGNPSNLPQSNSTRQTSRPERPQQTLHPKRPQTRQAAAPSAAKSTQFAPVTVPNPPQATAVPHQKSIQPKFLKGKAKQNTPTVTEPKPIVPVLKPETLLIDLGDKSATVSEKTVAPSAPIRRTAKLVQAHDNDGELAWRNHENPKTHLLIPAELLIYGSHGNEHIHESIARRHGAFVFAEAGHSSGYFNFGIWGTDSAVNAAEHALNKWIEKSIAAGKSKGGFHKLRSVTEEVGHKIEKQWRRDVKRHRFRQNPPVDTKFYAIGSFHWPADEFRPEDVLGTSFEALDPIRMEFQCYVTFRRERSTFEVCGVDEKVEKVKTALLRLRGTLFQTAARHILPLRNHLLYCPIDTDTPDRVSLTPYESPKPLSFSAPKNQRGHVPRAEGTDACDPHAQERLMSNELLVRDTVLATLRKLHYYRGYLQLRIRLGTFLATRFKEPDDGASYQLDEYEDMIQQSQFEGHVTEEIGNKSTEGRALQRLQNASDLLLPAESKIEHLIDVEPEYSARFTFYESAGSLQLTIVWRRAMDKENKSGMPDFEECSRSWMRLDRDFITSTPILESSLTDLNTGHAWAFEVVAAQPVDPNRLSEAYQTFGASVQLNASLATKPNDNKLFVVYRPPPPGVQVQHIQQRVTYRYNLLSPSLRTTEYLLELTRFQNCEFTTRTAPRNPSLAGPSHETNTALLYEARWALNLYCTGWDRDFARNAEMKVGEMAAWSHTALDWFPALNPQIVDDDEDDETVKGDGDNNDDDDGKTMKDGDETVCGSSEDDGKEVLTSLQQGDGDAGTGFEELMERLHQIRLVLGA